jgi:hypothetical protein
VHSSGSKQVNLNRIYQVSLSEFLTKGTPTLLIVNPNGIVRRAFSGKLTPAREREFLDAVKETANLPGERPAESEFD